MVLAGVLVATVATLAVRAKWVIERSYADVPEPAIVADRSPEGVARGELLFHSICFECHGGPDGRATGKALTEVPAFLGEFRSANLAHPASGVRALSDGKIARTIRNGILHDGVLSPVMSSFSKIGDRDIAAILGYVRSRPPVFEPAGEYQPRSRLTITGAVILTYVAKVSDAATAVPKTVAVPPKGPTVEYGRYMTEVLDCVACHTPGFGSDKMHDPMAFAGGFELTDPSGAKIWTKNITADDETGIGRWTVDDFEHAVAGGIAPGGHRVRKPMPLFARIDHTDAEAIYMFLRTMPKVRRPNTPGGAPAEKAAPSDPPAVLFTKLGCVACHGEGAPHRDKIAASIDKTDEEVASWILDPQVKKPGSAMPSFKAMIDRDQATGLARYAKSLASARASASHSSL
jgi:mono/diheme cytochrome c family protein